MASKIKVYGEAQNRTALGIFHAYMKLNPDATIEDLRNSFPDTLAPDKGVAEIFVDSDFDDKGEHYFTEADELVTTADGKKVAVVKLWTKPTFDSLVQLASDYGIEVAEFEQQQQVGKKGSYYLEYVNGYSPDAAACACKSKSGCMKWFWILLAILAIILIIFFLCRSCNSVDKTYMETNIVAVTTDTESPYGEVTNIPDDNAETTGIAAATTAAQATGNSGACTTATAEVVAQIEKYQKQFDAIEYPVGQYELKSEAKTILDNVARLMIANPGMKMIVNGYASREGSKEANQVLSDKRASIVVDYLVNKGVTADRLKAVGLCTSNPISDQLSPNRRIDFVVE